MCVISTIAYDYDYDNSFLQNLNGSSLS